MTIGRMYCRYSAFCSSVSVLPKSRVAHGDAMLIRLSSATRVNLSIELPSLGLRVADRRDLRLRRVTLTGSLAAALTRLPVGAHQRADGVHQERALDHRARAQRPHGRVSHRVAGGAIGSAKPSIRQHEPQALADEDLLSALFVLHQAQLWGFDDAVFSWEGLPELVFFQLDLESQLELTLERLHWRMPPYTGDVAKQVLCMRALADAAVRRRSEATLRRFGRVLAYLRFLPGCVLAASRWSPGFHSTNARLHLF